MLLKRSLLTALHATLLFSLAGCFPDQSPNEIQAGFFVGSAGRNGVSGFVPTGYG